MTLGRQFDLYTEHYERADDPVLEEMGIHNNPGYSETNYTLTDPNRARDGWEAQVGRVSVTHHSTNPIVTRYHDQSHPSGQRLTQPGPFGEPDEYGRLSDGQQRLFKEIYESSTPGKSVVDGLYATKEARAMALPLLAVAARDTALSKGRTLIASGDRSAHSERLVDRLAERGVADRTERTNANNLDFGPPVERDPDYLGVKRSPDVLAQGKRDARALLRQGRKPRETYVQERLL